MTEALDPKVAEFAANWLQGNLKAMKIDGFGPDDPPPPAWGPPLQVQEVPLPEIRDPRLDGEDPEPVIPSEPMIPPSPLVAAIPRPQPNPVAPIQARASLAIQDRLGSFQGQQVELSESEQASIARIVLEAVQRRLKAQLDAIRKQAPKRKRGGPVKAVQGGASEPQPTSPPRKRGRPKGSKNKAKA